MDRLKDGESDDMLQFFAAQHRNQILANIDVGEEALLDPLDRTDRADIVPGSYLKPYDDVCLYGYIYGRVVAGSTGDRTRFVTYRFDLSTGGGHALETWSLSDVTDRAPVDPNETPMPLTPPVEP